MQHQANQTQLYISFLWMLFICLFSKQGMAQAPSNDSCSNALPIVISGNGFDLGTFTSSTVDISKASIQAGESFAPAILVAGQTQKSVWYKFTVLTPRSIRVTLAQSGSAITAGDAGFAVYKSNDCVPGAAEISTKLTPIGLFGNTFHPCVDAGEYLVQVSGKAAANGLVYVQLEVNATTALYDHPQDALDIGTVYNGSKEIGYEVNCQSIDSEKEYCSMVANPKAYAKSTWHVFKTGNYFDFFYLYLYYYMPKSIRILKGDVRTSDWSSLPIVFGCDSIAGRGYLKYFRCGELDTNSVYSLQVVFENNFYGRFEIYMASVGSGPTSVPLPTPDYFAGKSNDLGTFNPIPEGEERTAKDVFACNSRHIEHPCEPSLPLAGVDKNGYKFNMSVFFKFKIVTTSNVWIYTQPDVLIRLYQQKTPQTCQGLDTSNVVKEIYYGGWSKELINCLPQGEYLLQVMAKDTINGYWTWYYPHTLFSGLGNPIQVWVTAKPIQEQNRYSLATPQSVNKINSSNGSLNPLVNGVKYQSLPDTFGCANTLLPQDTSCFPTYNKAIYRELLVADSGILNYGTSYDQNVRTLVYKGSASTLSEQQGIFSFPDRISGLIPQTNCKGAVSCEGFPLCVTPGNYSHVMFGGKETIGQVNQPDFIFRKRTTKFHDSTSAGFIGKLDPLNGISSIVSERDYFACKDNAFPINGYLPQLFDNNRKTTKAVYMQFYLATAADLHIVSGHYNDCGGATWGPPFTVFSGKISEGTSSLKILSPKYQWVYNGVDSRPCGSFEPGWYTIVSYGTGPNYADPFANLDNYGNSSSLNESVQITVYAYLDCAAPKYNRPNKAAIDTLTNQPFLIQWAPRSKHTTAIPKTDTTYTLYTENLNCTVDTPFNKFYLDFFRKTTAYYGAVYTKTSYYVFRTTQESFVQIDLSSNNYYHIGAVYEGNARTDSLIFKKNSPIQACQERIGTIQINRLQPGTYTLVIFSDDYYNKCGTITPNIYIDRLETSRFDHATNAYDFGVIPPDSMYHLGKVGDVNPLNASRAPSNDFFSTSTGAQNTDPTHAVCGEDWTPNIYKDTINNALFNFPSASIPRRNLWYSFVIEKGGNVRVKVINKTPGKTIQYPFAVYKSNADGSLSLADLKKTGQIDSTEQQGLSLIRSSLIGYWCISSNEISFLRDPCNSVPERYYVLVENRNGYGEADIHAMNPNHQVEVSVLFDSINTIQPKFDHYYQAYNIGTNLKAGKYKGEEDNYTCATKDATDPVYYNCGANKTLWYKFSVGISGVLRLRAFLNNNQLENDLELLKETVPGDSTTNGLKIINANFNHITGFWEMCIAPGNYYLIMKGCNKTIESVYPEIELVEQKGDYCSLPVAVPLSGPGNNSGNVLVDCLTIGTDYGEFNETLTCPAGGPTNQFKTAWFRMDIGGKDTLDVTTYLSTYTNVPPTAIKYRMMNGDCSAMQERSCVQDAQTRDTYKCLAPGSYFIQVFVPYNATGPVTLNLSAVLHADTCAPVNNCLSNANFQTGFDCTKSQAVSFTNYSTFGSNIAYEWDFGYNGAVSNAVSPKFVYPGLTTSKKYYITLKVKNTACNGESIFSDSIVIPPRPEVHLGNDTVLCQGGTLLLNSSSYEGSTYRWQGWYNQPIYTAGSDEYKYYVQVEYKGCYAWDTIIVAVNNITPTKQNKFLCAGDPIDLNAYRGRGESYRWSTGSTAASISVRYPGWYWVDLNLFGCIKRDSFYVSNAAVPLGPDREACFATTPVALNATTAGAQGYTWQDGSTGPNFSASRPGLYWVDLSFGSCLLRDTVVLTDYQPAFSVRNELFCTGSVFKLPSGKQVTTGGTYKDTLKTTTGCDSLLLTYNLTEQFIETKPSTHTICQGQTFQLPWGPTVSTAGIYRDTLRYVATGCDSLHRIVTLTVQIPTSWEREVFICKGQTHTLPWGLTVSSTGIYRDTLHFSNTGCDSVWRTVRLTVQEPRLDSVGVVICKGQSYNLPWGPTVTASGIYRDTLRYAATGCDSVYKVINLLVHEPTDLPSSPTICQGQTFQLPWGQTVSTAGIYRDTLRYASTGCDSLRRIVTLTVQTPTSWEREVFICQGQTHTLPWGLTVSSTGIYRDTLHYSNTGCDSVWRTVRLTVQEPRLDSVGVVICKGQSYNLPWGPIVTASGIYRDTLRYATTGCDRVYKVINLLVQQPTDLASNPTICQGQTFQLPWGQTVSTAGIYRDTLRYATTACDSLHRIVTLTVQTPTPWEREVFICKGQTHTLPWGLTVSSTGIYRDTLHYSSTGCDSVWRTVRLTVQEPTLDSIGAIICKGQSYNLPWGPTVTTSGIYRDTLRYATTGCDSVYKVINLLVHEPTDLPTSHTICQGQTFQLPWGPTVSTAGIYRDTLRYVATGCDSLRRIVTLTVQTPTPWEREVFICKGQTHTLPWGLTVSSTGIYRDTLHYSNTGCDSVWRTVRLTVQEPRLDSIGVVICKGQSYNLPWGPTATTAGIYRDTLKYASTGCDSVYTVINLLVHEPTDLPSSPTICQGQTFQLPWGQTVSTAGIYRDTLRYVATGCDSLRRIVTLTVQTPTSWEREVFICKGQTHTLPWGLTVSSTGIYRDTLHYSNTSCDSVWRTVRLTVQEPRLDSVGVVICKGQSYNLPWGPTATIAGIYRDTLKYASTGCDSVYKVFKLLVQEPLDSPSYPTICQGQSFRLPWGQVVNSSGTYRDTLRYVTTGCDSLRRIVLLTVVPAQKFELNPVICADSSFKLPWGTVVNKTGTYIDTVRTKDGCDSLIRIIHLTVHPIPNLTITKSNDVSCLLGITHLTATAGYRYQWTPTNSLDQPNSRTPIAYPVTKTIYKLAVVDQNNCKKTDSILVDVNATPSDKDFPVPNAFTPNGDGKNDCFGISKWGQVSNLKFAIYNRWGQLVFETTQISDCWDGRVNGTLQTTAGFVYIISANTLCGRVERKGMVMLIR